MLDRLGIFDFFSYTLPGAVYLSAIITILNLWEIVPALPNLHLDASVFVILVTLSYLIGLLMSFLKWTPWDRLFPSPKIESILEKLQKTYPDVNLQIRPNQWPVIQANMALEDLAFSLAVDKLRATQLMLRSLSLALFIFTIICVIYNVGHPTSLLGWLATIVFLGSSALATKGSRKFKSMTYHYTFELMIARVVKPEDFVKRNSQPI